MPEAETSTQTIGDRARIAIMHSGLVQREVSRRTGIEESKLSKSLRGTRRFAPEEINLLANVTGVTSSWLLTGSDSGQEQVSAPSMELLPPRPAASDRNAGRRQAIVEQAWWLFAQQGYDAVRLSDIAKKCQVSTPAVHYYFANKQELFTEVLRYSIKLAYDRQVAELLQITDPLRRLKRLVELQLPAGEEGAAEWSIWMQTWVKVAVGNDGLSTHTPGYLRWETTVRETIEAGQASGQIILEDSKTLSTELTALIDGMGIKVLTKLMSAQQMHEMVCRYIDRNYSREHPTENQTSTRNGESDEP